MQATAFSQELCICRVLYKLPHQSDTASRSAPQRRRAREYTPSVMIAAVTPWAHDLARHSSAIIREFTSDMDVCEHDVGHCAQPRTRACMDTVPAAKPSPHNMSEWLGHAAGGVVAGSMFMITHTLPIPGCARWHTSCARHVHAPRNHTSLGRIRIINHVHIKHVHNIQNQPLPPGSKHSGLPLYCVLW